jgi:hypothetical protein
MRRSTRLLVAALACWSFAALAYGTVRLTFGPRPVYVNVRWADGVDAATRRVAETRFGLADGELREGTTWGYALTDRSRANIRALVEDPAVADTHQIHRTAFRVGYSAQRLPYRGPRAWMAVALERIAILALIAGALVLAGIDRGARAFVVWIRGRIPAVSPEAAALFRIVFGSALLFFLLRRPVDGLWAIDPSNSISGVHRWLLQIFVAVPSIADWIAPWVALWGVLFIAGAWARVAFAMLTLGAMLWALLYTTQTTYHTISALLLTLLCLQWGRWSDAWSVDARRTGPPGPVSPQEYGFTVWAPGFVLGVVYLAAAIAKLRDGGVAWILNGTVKYHFLSDSPQAAVDWGLRLGRYHWVAVLLSFSAIAIEALVIAGVLSRAYRYRALAGLGALGLVSGFSLLQGLFWPGWWLLLLSFLPWHLVPSRESPRAVPAAPPRPAVVRVIVGFLAVQCAVSLARLEVSPLISAYDMYATTYASPAEYEQKAGEQYWIVATDDRGTRDECRISPDEVEALGKPVYGPLDRGRVFDVLQRCFAPAARFNDVAVEAQRVRVDWDAWRLDAPQRTKLFSVVVNQ